MQKFDFLHIKKDSHIHFVGIGGISMSALAAILLSKGYHVSGSDSKESEYTNALAELGAEIFIGHSAENAKNADALVYSAAIKPENPEREYAKEKGILQVPRSVLLGAIERLYKYPIDISGTHGKTSTTGMLAHIFFAAEKNPTVLIGGSLDLIGGNMHIGKDEVFISEACEYHRSFLDFSPYISIILDVDADHLDYYKDIEDIKDAFSHFAALASGKVVINADDKNTVDAVKGIADKVITTSRTKNADFYVKNLVSDDFGHYSFDVFGDNRQLTHVTLGVPGIHHVSNALCAFAAAYTLGVSPCDIAKGLSAFSGVDRRFQLKADIEGVRVYDDYAHHPTEIRATLTALSSFAKGEKYIIFQPHTYTRTLALFDEFVDALNFSGHVVITDIYAAREKDTGKVSGAMLAEKISGAHYAESFDAAAEYVLSRLKPGDIVMTVGAGDVYKVGELIVKGLKR